MNIGAKLREIRNLKRKFLWELSEETNIPQSTISEFERGVRDIKFSEVLAICKALNVSIKLVDAD